MEHPPIAGGATARPPGFTALAIAVGLAIAVAGCALPAPVASGKNWKIAPSYRVIHTGPGADQGYRALARRYEGEWRWREARDAWRKAAAEAPNDADILNALGMAEAGQGLYADSIAALRRAMAAAPERVALRNNLGYALLLAGRDDEARTVLRDALERDPEHQQARANLDRIDQVAVAVASTADRTAGNTAVAAAGIGPSQAPAAGSLQTIANLAPLQVRQMGSAVATGVPVVPVVATGVPVVATVVEAAALADLRAPVATKPRIEIANGNGNVGMAGRLRDRLSTRGVTGQVVLTNALPYNTATSVVRYRAGFVATAQEVANGMSQRVVIAPTLGGALNADVRVLLGRDQL